MGRARRGCGAEDDVAATLGKNARIRSRLRGGPHEAGSDGGVSILHRGAPIGLPCTAPPDDAHPTELVLRLCGGREARTEALLGVDKLAIARGALLLES